jgi:hypothetical protein
VDKTYFVLYSFYPTSVYEREDMLYATQSLATAEVGMSTLNKTKARTIKLHVAGVLVLHF